MRLPDPRAVKILLDTYWTRAGWRSEPVVEPESLAYARRAGLMFEPIKIDHDDVISRLDEARRELNVERVADAFVSSLGNRRLYLRSALASYSIFRHMPIHRADFFERTCVVCGMSQPRDERQDISVLNFERFKFGGVRHDQALYAAIDLELFAQEEHVAASASDRALFRDLLSAIRGTLPTTSAARLQTLFARTFKSNKAERDVVVAILGFCGVLAPADHPSYRQRFIRPNERSLPDRRFVDMPYPACWWQGSAGIDDGALQEFFGHLL